MRICFMGPTGSGRRLIARAFAKALLCARPTPSGGCGQSESCRHFDHGVHPRFAFLTAEGKDKLIKVEKVSVP
jgi:DNA polymerase-3 subunit delta'